MQDFNILIIDDGSTDNTVLIIEDYKQMFNGRFQSFYLSSNLGSPAKTRNYAMNTGCIDGKYVLFLDGDDSISPLFLEKLYKAAEENCAQIALCSYKRVDIETGNILCKEMIGFPELIILPAASDILPFINSSLWNKLIRTNLIENKRIPDFKVGEDLCLLHVLYSNCHYIATVNEVLVDYHVRKNSIINNTEVDTIKLFADELLRIYNESSNCKFKESIALTNFIHIGISMAMRANDNNDINISKHLKWTKNYFVTHYKMFQYNEFLTFHNLRKMKGRGIAIWICKISYKINIFRLVLFFYNIVKRIFNLDFKF